MSQTKFSVTFDLVFDHDELDKGDLAKLKALTPEKLEEAINTGFEYDAFNFFGESIAMLGLLTPRVNTVTKA